MEMFFCDTQNITSPVYGSIQKEIFYFQFVSRLFGCFCSAIEIEQSKYDGDATDDDFNFREDFLEDIDLMLKSKLKDVEAEGFKQFFLARLIIKLTLLEPSLLLTTFFA